MQDERNFKSLGWVIMFISALIIIVGGIAYAALQSQQVKLTANSIETSTADLKLSLNGVNYGNSETGFDFNNLIPGGPAVPVTGQAFYLNNNGGTPLALKLAVATTPSNPDNVDLSQVNIILTTVGSSGVQSFSLQSLISAYSSGGLAITGPSLGANTVQEYKLQVSMNTAAVNGSSATIGNIDFALSGIAQAA